MYTDTVIKRFLVWLIFVLIYTGCGGPHADGIKCGAAICAAGSELCCSSDWGATGTCQPVTTEQCKLSDNNLELFCDGSEDCPSDDDCCIVGGNSTCRPIGTCPAQLPLDKPYIVCHVDLDCPSAQPRCTAIGGLKVCAQ